MMIDAKSARYCYLDLDLNGHRDQLATAAAFCAATDTRYGFSSRHLLQLGGSEVARIPELMASDHEWSHRVVVHQTTTTAIQEVVRPPEPGHRLVVQLYWDVAPLACENFATLCANGSTTTTTVTGGSKTTTTTRRPAPLGTSGKPLTYRGSTVHRIVPDFVLQGGDFVFGNGSGGEPAINNGKKFKDERAGLLLKHNRRGLLSMGNSGKHSNSSQWFLTLNSSAPQCDGKHVIFGELVSGWPVLAAAERLGSPDGTPTGPVVVTDCGIWDPGHTPGAGYWYDQPDPDAYTGVSPIFIVRPRVVTVSPTDAVRDKFRQALAAHHAIETELVLTVGSSDNTQAGDEPSSSSTSISVVAQQLHELLQKCALDVIVVAPACPVDQLAADLTKHCGCDSASTIHWGNGGVVRSLPLNGVLLTAKPLEAATTIRTKSWLAEQSHWKLDGIPQ